MGEHLGRSERPAMPRTLPALRDWLAAAPPGTMLAADALRATLSELEPVEAPGLLPAVRSSADAPAATWRERLWIAPAETRLGVRECAEAIGRPVSFVYRHTSEKCEAGDRLPHKKLDGELTFVAGELRAWILEHEETITSGPTAPNRRLALTTSTGGRGA